MCRIDNDRKNWLLFFYWSLVIDTIPSITKSISQRDRLNMASPDKKSLPLNLEAVSWNE